MKISVVIPHRNDLAALRNTIETLESGTSQIIVVDDASDELQRPDTHRFPVKVIQLNHQQGPARCRDLGVDYATGDVLLFTDSHMIFPPNWREQVCRGLDWLNNFEGIICSHYYSDRPFDKGWFSGDAIGGASLQHYALRPEIKGINICDMTPMHAATEHECFRVPAVIGACYAMTSDWYKRIGGLTGLDGYGCEEQLLSWKTWMADGEVICNPQLRVVHIDQRDKNLVHDPMKYLRNKLFVERLIMLEPDWGNLVGCLPPSWLEQVLLVAGAELPEIPRLVHPDKISDMFGMQTIAEAIELAGKI